MNSAAPTMTVYRLPENCTRFDISFPRARAGLVVSVELPTDSLDDVKQEAIERLAKSLGDNIEWLTCASEIEHLVWRKAVKLRKRTNTILSRCEDTINHAATILPRRKGLEIVTIGSVAKQPR
jgi:hypothetical protein